MDYPVEVVVEAPLESQEKLLETQEKPLDTLPDKPIEIQVENLEAKPENK